MYRVDFTKNNHCKTMTDKTSSIILDDPSLFVFKIALLKSSRDASYK